MPKSDYKWKVGTVPTGRLRSFERREWPSAYYTGDRIAASISCEAQYRPEDAKSGDHPELTVRVADYSVTPWRWRRLNKKPATLGEAKDLFAQFLAANPSFKPEDLR